MMKIVTNYWHDICRPIVPAMWQLSGHALKSLSPFGTITHPQPQLHVAPLAMPFSRGFEKCTQNWEKKCFPGQVDCFENGLCFLNLCSVIQTKKKNPHNGQPKTFPLLDVWCIQFRWIWITLNGWLDIALAWLSCASFSKVSKRDCPAQKTVRDMSKSEPVSLMLLPSIYSPTTPSEGLIRLDWSRMTS